MQVLNHFYGTLPVSQNALELAPLCQKKMGMKEVIEGGVERVW
jgi:hypothetical protein